MRRSLAGAPRLGTDARYRLIRKISEDKVGNVWTAEDIAFGRPVTIRVIVESLRSHDRFTEAFASTTEQLLHPVWMDGALRPPISHPNAARVFNFDLGNSTSPAFVVMERLEGEPLAELLSRQGRLDADAAVRITIAVAGAAHAAHEVGLVHGAITPATLLIDSRRTVKVFDFGVAAAYGPLLAELDTELAPYLAPELLAGREPTSRSDMFAVGAVLFAMLTGVPSRVGGLGATERIRRVFGDVRGDLAHLCSRALAQDPHARPASLEDFASRLSQASSARRVTEGGGSLRELPGGPVRRPGPSNEKGKGEVPVLPRRSNEAVTNFLDPARVEASLRKLVRDREAPDDETDTPPPSLSLRPPRESDAHRPSGPEDPDSDEADDRPPADGPDDRADD